MRGAQAILERRPPFLVQDRGAFELLSDAMHANDRRHGHPATSVVRWLVSWAGEAGQSRARAVIACSVELREERLSRRTLYRVRSRGSSRSRRAIRAAYSAGDPSSWMSPASARRSLTID